ncbi:MAG: hypothetical protein AABZ12_05470 [Planctomycetota bacterium]
MIDTGASCTCIDPASLRSLGLSPTGRVPIHTPSTNETPLDCEQYDVSLVLLHPKMQLALGSLGVIASNLEFHGIQALFGRDVLGRCLFVYDSSAQVFALAF